MDPAPSDDGTITIEQWRARHAVKRPLPDPPEEPQPPQPAPVARRSWADLLEQKARRCRGCGEWTFTEWCDWCSTWEPETEPVVPTVVHKERTGTRPTSRRKSLTERAPSTTSGGQSWNVTYECCEAKRDTIGRLPIGFCGPECQRRADR